MVFRSWLENTTKNVRKHVKKNVFRWHPKCEKCPKSGLAFGSDETGSQMSGIQIITAHTPGD